MKKILLLLLSIYSLSVQLHAFENLKFHTLSNKGGLSYDRITDIKQDGKGFMWILLETNLFRFDGYSYKSFKEYFDHNAAQQLGYFKNLTIDQNGDVYVSSSNGIHRYNYTTDTFIKITDIQSQLTYIDSNNKIWLTQDEGISYLLPDTISKKNNINKNDNLFWPHFKGNKQSLHKRIICEDDNGYVYFFSRYGKIFRYDEKCEIIEEWTNLEIEFNGSYLADASIKNGEIWLLTQNFTLLRLNLHNKELTYKYTHPFKKNQGLRKLYISDDRAAWVGTINGLYILDTQSGNIFLHQNKEDNIFSLPNNSIWTINEDNQKNVWIGTYMGSLIYVNKYDNKIFETYSLSPEGLNIVPASGFTEIDGKIWVSTEGGGINVFDKKNNKFSYIRQKTDGISSNNTKSSVTDKEGNVWIATFLGGLNCYDSKTKQFVHYRKESNNIQSPYSNNLRKIILEPDSGLWIIYQEHVATISFFSFKNHSFTHIAIDKGEDGFNLYDYIYDAYRDKDGHLWLITSYSLFSLNVATEEVQKYTIPTKNNPASTLCVDDDAKVWIGTFGNELIRFNPKDTSFRSFPNIIQSSIAEIYSINHSKSKDNVQTIWLGTNDGLYMFHANTGGCVVFKESDGTQGNVYYPLSTYKDKNDLLYFGGTGGFTIVDPSKVVLNPQKPYASISDFFIDNQSVLNNEVLQKTNIRISGSLTEINLNHTQQNFGFKLTSDNYLYADKNQFRYRLKNYDDRWIQTDAYNRTVFYSKIPAGKYVFEFQAANNDGILGEINSIRIIRKQTPWLTFPALFLYFTLFCSLLYYFYRTRTKRKRLELQLYLDQVEKEKNEEIHKNQLQFFTNISHDLKTPLSLIMITINKMREEGMREYYYKILNNNSERLLRLLNDLLDFRKIKNNKVDLKVSKDNLGKFIQTLSGDFQEYARHKEINYQIITDDEAIATIPFDKKVMEKIVMNLLINSFKYTRRGDSITIMGGVKDFKSKYANSYSVGEENLTECNNTVSIIVKDTGIGITNESISKVFDRFYQVESNNQANHLGTGIGLALVKNLVLLHRGSITIYSEQHVGSDFVITLAASTDHYLPSEIQENVTSEIIPHQSDIENLVQAYPESNYKAILADDISSENYDGEKTIILAEDNTALRSIIRSSLREKYNVIDFDNGKPALEYLKSNNVDLIISDIMMPGTDGITFCKTIKNNMETSHIPFIMLTAKSGLESMLEGTESGADLYFEKPIDLTLLKTSIANIFKQQEVLREYYAKNYFAEISSVSQNKQDNQFLQEVCDIIDKHLDRSDMDVNTIASEMSMSRSKLYSKIKALTGKSVVEFILSYRLRRAAKLLVEKDMSIQQAMYMVGIESQSYFTRAFKKEFEMPPSKFVLQFKENSNIASNEG